MLKNSKLRCENIVARIDARIVGFYFTAIFVQCLYEPQILKTTALVRNPAACLSPPKYHRTGFESYLVLSYGLTD